MKNCCLACKELSLEVDVLYITSPQKQVTDVNFVLKDGDMESENLSSLIRHSASDSQKTDSSKDVSFIGTRVIFSSPEPKALR